MSAGADAFYADAGYEHAGEDDFEPQVVEDLQPGRARPTREGDLRPRLLGGRRAALGRGRRSTGRRGAGARVRAALRDVRRPAARPAHRRAVEETGSPEIHLPALQDTAAGLLRDKQWLRDHDTLSGEPLIAAALKDAIGALGPAGDETDLLRRRELRMRAQGLTLRGEVDDGTR